MAVEEVHIPPKTTSKDPKELGEKAEKPGYYGKATKELREKREYLEESKMMDNLNAETPEPPFQLKGSVNLGNIDIQEQNKQAQEAIARDRAETQKRLDDLTDKNEQITKELHETQIKASTDLLLGQISELKIQQKVQNILFFLTVFRTT